MSKVKKPELEQCSGLTPAIAVRQNQFGKNPRSTVGTVTEIFDLYRLLFSRAGLNKDGNITKLPASMFSFNKLEAACPKCKGLGIITTSDPEKFITHPDKAIISGAMDGTTPGKFFGDIYGQYINTLIKVGELKGIDFTLPYHKLSQKAVQIALFGTGTEEYDVEWKFRRGNRTGTHNLTTVWKGFVNYFNEDWEIKHDGKRGEAFKAIMSEINCSDCQGKRFRKNILDVSFDGMNISQLSSKTITNAIEYFSNIQKEINPETFAVCEQITVQLITKLKSLDEIGLGYLSIDRTTQTLSGGEAQRLRIASQLVSDLCGLTYVLDEPTLGLHPRDTQNLMKSIRKLKDNGNTVILVEHDPDVISHADYIIDIGPGAGENGGKIIAQGSINDIIKNPKSITGKYLSNDRQEIIRQKINEQEREPGAGISITGAYANNLKNISINIPAGGIIAVTGVSGSGKTSIAFDVIANSYNAGKAINCDKIIFNNIDSIAIIDQQRIGTSPLSTPATYTGLFDIIRDLFARLDESKVRGLKKSHFSFNSKEGRCPACKGMGNVKVSMDFLSDVWVSCDTCHGKRYKDSILEIRYKNLNINEVLELEVSEAYNIFEDNTKIRKILSVLREIGLGYLKLGQATSTLSGGETQRLKLASKLIREFLGNCLLIFDEPTTGLHMQDVEKLITVFNKLVNNGNTVLLVEHNLTIIQASDWIIDLGPEGGDEGGDIIYSGSPSEILECTESYTGQALINMLG